eukprot:391302_1
MRNRSCIMSQKIPNKILLSVWGTKVQKMYELKSNDGCRIRKEDDLFDPMHRTQNVKYQKHSAYREAAKRFEERVKIHNSTTNLLSSLCRMHKLDDDLLTK